MTTELATKQTNYYNCNISSLGGSTTSLIMRSSFYRCLKKRLTLLVLLLLAAWASLLYMFVDISALVSHTVNNNKGNLLSENESAKSVRHENALFHQQNQGHQKVISYYGRISLLNEREKVPSEEYMDNGDNDDVADPNRMKYSHNKRRKKEQSMFDSNNAQPGVWSKSIKGRIFDIKQQQQQQDIISSYRANDGVNYVDEKIHSNQ